MAKSKGIDMKLPSVADLFTTQEQRDEDKRENVREISLTEISDFPNHPYHDLTNFQNGTYSLFTPIAPAENKISTPPVPTDRSGRAEQEFVPAEDRGKAEQESVDAGQKEKQPQETGSTMGMEFVQYNLQVDKVVFIGLKEYRIELLTPEMAVLRDENYPLFTEEMPRAEFERKVRENPANDHLIIKWSQPELPAEKTDIETESELPAKNPEMETESELPQEKGLEKVADESGEISQNSLTAAEKNYRTIMKLAPEVLRGEKDSLTFEAGASFICTS